MDKQNNYDLYYELGPENEYDKIAGKALEIGRKYSNLFLIEQSEILAKLIRNIPFNHDEFPIKVIPKAKEILKYIHILENETVLLQNYEIIFPELKLIHQFPEPTLLKLKLESKKFKIEIGNYRYKVVHDLLIENYLQIFKIIAEEFPDLKKFEKFQFKSSEEQGDRTGTNIKTYENNFGEVIFEDLFRNHENSDYEGQVFSFIFPKNFTKEKIKLILDKIITYLQESKLEVKNILNKSEEQERILRKFRGETEDEYFFKSWVKEILEIDNENTKKLLFINLIQIIENQRVSLEACNFAINSFYKKYQFTEEENIKISKLIKAKKYFYSRKKITSFRDKNLEITYFEEFLLSHNLRFTSANYKFNYKDIDPNHLVKLIKEKFNPEIFIKKVNNRDLIYIKIKSQDNTYWFEILPYELSYTRDIKTIFYDVIAENTE